MLFKDKTVVVTGGASGIGAALVEYLTERGARVAVADREKRAVQDIVLRLGCVGFECDVADEKQVNRLISDVTETLGAIDCFVSNAGLFEPQPDHAASASNDVWSRNWSVHVMAHVYAARALLPQMRARGSGYFVNVTSAAGLLHQIENAAYSATKHAAVSFAESLAISHGDAGIGVSVVCPQYVATPLIGLKEADARETPGLLTACDVARAIVEGVEANRFLILPHPEVAGFAQARARDHDAWIAGMRRLRNRAIDQIGDDPAAKIYRLF